MPPPCPAPYLTHDLDMCDSEWGAQASLGLVAKHGQHKVPRLAETLTHEKCPRLTLGLQQCLCLPSRHVTMVPPREGSMGVRPEPGAGMSRRSQRGAGNRVPTKCQTLLDMLSNAPPYLGPLLSQKC